MKYLTLFGLGLFALTVGAYTSSKFDAAGAAWTTEHALSSHEEEVINVDSVQGFVVSPINHENEKSRTKIDEFKVENPQEIEVDMINEDRVHDYNTRGWLPKIVD